MTHTVFLPDSQVEICAIDDKPSLSQHDTVPVNQETTPTKEMENSKAA